MIAHHALPRWLTRADAVIALIGKQIKAMPAGLTMDY
jgi:hypothetical protein